MPLQYVNSFVARICIVLDGGSPGLLVVTKLGTTASGRTARTNNKGGADEVNPTVNFRGGAA
jgi:hypothetical protein